MYPPLDPRLLEARSSALVLAVGQLALLAQNISGSNKSYLNWIDQSLEDLDNHLMGLRIAAQELNVCNQTEFKNNLLIV